MLHRSPFHLHASTVKPRTTIRYISRSMATTIPNYPSSSTPYHPPRPRRFTPLNTSYPNIHSSPTLHGIIFDVDGTLCLPQNHMFREMRAALSIPKSVDILDHIRSLSDEPDEAPPSSPCKTSDPAGNAKNSARDLLRTSVPPPETINQLSSSPRSRAVAAIQSIERNAMTTQTPQPGLSQLMTYLSSKSIPKALCTRNFPAPVHHLLEKYLPGEKFWPVITRDTEGVLPKPSPEGLWYIARAWGLGVDVPNDTGIDIDGQGGVEPDSTARATTNGGQLQDQDPLELARRHLGANLIMVGDSVDDLAAGYRAGAATVLLVNEENEHLVEHEDTDLVISRLDEMVEVLERGFEGRS